MSIDLAANDDYLHVSTTFATLVPPFSWFCHVYPWRDGNRETMLFFGDDSVADQAYSMSLHGDQAGDYVNLWSRNAAGFSAAITTTSFTTGSWQKAMGIYTTTASRTVYLNNAGADTETTSRVVTGPDLFAIGRSADSTPTNQADLMIAEVAIWDAVLTEASRTALQNNTYPDEVQVADLVEVWHLNDNTDLTGAVNSNVLTAESSPATGASHPSMQHAGADEFVTVLIKAASEAP